ncbi:MAG: HDOD domain-containing protein [Nitrospirales bacterium]|nr:HDOD domain-containing protein [Nitrospira sp.]MDR4501504.1 HDOD domain-containing protein [Nitrospirales bacterium]
MTNADSPLFARLRKSLHLPPLPPIASQIMKMCRDENTEVEQLAHLMSQDPAVVARLLQIANSSYYGGARHKVTGIVQAITLLGMDAVSSLALSFCFYRLCRDIERPNSSGIDHVTFWRRSIISSITGRTIAKWHNVADPEFVFLASLLQDIGLLALNGVDPHVMRDLMENAQDSHLEFAGLEKTHFGCDHAEVGSWIAMTWELPEEYHTAIKASHDPLAWTCQSEEEACIIRCVALASQLADLWCYPKNLAQTTEIAANSAKEWLDLDPVEVQGIISLIPDGLSDISGFFQVHIGRQEDIVRPVQISANILSPDASCESQPEPVT